METVFKAFGKFVKEMRLNMGMTLQRFCAEYGYNHIQQSKLERGLAFPQRSEDKLTELANNLRISNSSKDWHRFFALAAECDGKLPPVGLTDEELLPLLPYFLRTTDGSELSYGDLMNLAQEIRTA